MREIEIPDLELIEFVGSGANAVVYAGRDEATEELVAAKVMHVGIEGGARRFDRETRAMSRLSGVPGIVPILRSGLLDGERPYLLMPLYKASLQELMNEGGPIGSAEATAIMARISAAIAAGHELGVLHLDIKPSNILLDADGVAAIADFGIAELTDASSSLSGAMLTPQFSGPERFHDTKPTAAADVYSLGATLFALHRGQPPFTTGEAATPAALMLRVLNEDVPLDDLPKSTPDGVRAAIATAMERETGSRPSAAHFAEMLQAEVDPSASGVSLLNRLPASDALTVPVGVAPQPAAADGGGQRRHAAAGMIIAAMLIIGLVAIFANRPSSEQLVVAEVAGDVETTTPNDESAPATDTDDVVPESTTSTAAPSTSTTLDDAPSTTTTSEDSPLTEESLGSTDATTTTAASPTTSTGAPPTSTAAPTTTATPTTTTTTPRLGVPTNLQEFSQGHRNGRQFITIRWTTPPGSTGIEIQRNGTTVESKDANDFYSDEAVFAQGQSVQYRIRAIADGQTSPWSALITVVFDTPVPAPDPPTGLHSDNQGHHIDGRQFINLRWAAPPGAVVDVQRDGQTITTGDDNNVFWDGTTFTQGQAVSYRVRSVVGGQTSPWSAPITVVFNTPVPVE